jgi:response regulator RpfG family c-di-GMP phosphodiesterase
MVGDREKALAAGCDEYISKPIEIKRLKSMVARFLVDPEADCVGKQSVKEPEEKKADRGQHK